MPAMTIRSSIYGCSAVLALSAFFATSALGQAPSSSSASMEQELENLRAENAASRELLKALADKVDKLQRRLDGEPATVVHESPPLTLPPTQPLPTAPIVAQPESVSHQAAQPDSGRLRQKIENRYRDGIIIGEAPENAEVPFLLRFQGTTQIRYINTLSSQNTFTDHLGNTYDVHKRNDITVNRSMTVFNGYIFSKKALYSFTTWTSAGAASIVVAGNIGWQ